jgi:hypothetical protein
MTTISISSVVLTFCCLGGKDNQLTPKKMNLKLNNSVRCNGLTYCTYSNLQVSLCVSDDDCDDDLDDHMFLCNAEARIIIISLVEKELYC